MDTKKELTTESLIVLFVMVLCVSGFTAFIDRFFSISQNSFQAIASIGLVSAILMIVVIKFYGFENFEILLPSPAINKTILVIFIFLSTF